MMTQVLTDIKLSNAACNDALNVVRDSAGNRMVR